MSSYLDSFRVAALVVFVVLAPACGGGRPKPDETQGIRERGGESQRDLDRNAPSEPRRQ
jgi:hypothetical protein